MGGEAGVIAVARAIDFFLDGRRLKVPTDAMVGYVRRRKALDWKRSRFSMLDVEAVPTAYNLCMSYL
jgi:hypothetical protein